MTSTVAPDRFAPDDFTTTEPVKSLSFVGVEFRVKLWSIDFIPSNRIAVVSF